MERWRALYIRRRAAPGQAVAADRARVCRTIRRNRANYRGSNASVGWDHVAGRHHRGAAGRRRTGPASVEQEDLMAMVKAGIAGAAVGALALATILFVAPIAAQGPGGPFSPPGGPYGAPSGPPYGAPGGPYAIPGGPRGPAGPSAERSGDITGPPRMNRRGPDPGDPDITGPRGAVAACQERLMRMAQARLERIALLVRPTDEQRGAFEELQMASAKAVEILRAACPAEQPLTPTARMAQAERWLEARLQAIRLTRPVLEGFYRLLSDEQKIRWSLGPRMHDRFGVDPHRYFGRPGPDQQMPGFDRRGDERRGDERRGGESWREERWRDQRPRGGERFGDERGRAPDYGERWRERYRDREAPWRERGRRDDSD